LLRRLRRFATEQKSKLISAYQTVALFKTVNFGAQSVNWRSHPVSAGLRVPAIQARASLRISMILLDISP
jgi:hypothetical protein